MISLLNVLIGFGTLILTVVLTLFVNINKYYIWSSCTLILLFILIKELSENRNKKNIRKHDQDERNKLDFAFHILEKGELRRLGLPDSYIDALGKDPLLKHHFNRAQHFERNNNYRDAKAEYFSCLEYPNIPLLNKAIIYIGLSNCFFNLNKYEESYSQLHKTIAFSNQIENVIEKKRILAISFYNLAYLDFHFSKIRSALNYIEKALKIFLNINDVIYIAHSYYTRGILHLYLGDLDSAEQSLISSKSLLDGSQNSKGIASVKMELGHICFIRGDIEKSSEYLKIALELSLKSKDNAAIATINVGLGIICAEKENYDEAEQYFQQSLEFNLINRNENEKAICLENIGLIKIRKGEHSKALEFLSKALKIFEINGSEKGVAKTLEDIGLVHLQKGQYIEARKKFDIALSMQKKIGSKQAIASILGNYGNSFYLNSDHKSAIRYFKESAIIFAETGNLNGLDIATGNIVSAYLKLGNPEDIAPELKKVLTKIKKKMNKKLLKTILGKYSSK